jgi:hypothetical protein
MRKIGRITGLKAALLLGVVMCFGMAGTAAAAQTNRYCEVALSNCPNEYDGDTLVVPLDVIAFSMGVKACTIVDSTVSEGGDPPAIMFIIDHSTSMNNNGDCQNGGCDPSGSRFQVTRALIDSIYAAFPKAEVGITVFANGLVFDANRDANLVTYDDVYEGVSAAGDTLGIPRQSYMPLAQLDAAAKTGGTNPFYTGTAAAPKVVDVYRSMFTRTGNSWGLNGRSTMGGTNISLAFATALKAFENTTIPKKDQYIVFISDGINRLIEERQGPCTGPNQWCGRGEDFAAGVNTPTTYTVFLQGRALNPTEPEILRLMTNSVKNNSYSETNEKSDIWAVNDGYEALLALMMENIFKDMLSKTSGAPGRITISSSGGAADTAGVVKDGNFTFSRQLPIDTLEVTTVNMSIRYEVTKDTTFVGDNGQLVDSTLPPRLEDVVYSFNVRRTQTPEKTLAQQSLSERKCGSTTLDLRYGGESLVGKQVKGYMNELTIVFDNSDGLFEYREGVTVQVQNADGSFTDVENVKLTRSGDIWTGEFRRMVADVALPDGALQHMPQDSIIVIFRNPYIPLDVVRLSVPYVSMRMAFYDKPGDPYKPGVNEYVIEKTVTVIAGEPLDIYAKLFDSDDRWDEDLASDPSKFTWTVSNTGNARIESDGAHGQFYSETSGRYTVKATFRDGTMVISRELEIEVKPADPYFLEVLFDSTKIAAKVDTVKLNERKEYEFVKGANNKTFYVVERDRFGNLIGPPEGAVWESNNTGSITADPRNEGSSAVVTRHGKTFVDGLTLTVTKDGLKSAVVDIKVVGESSVAIGPNPFVPGKSDVRSRLEALDNRTYDIYRDIVERTGPGSGGGSPSTGVSTNGTGVLVAATAPRSISRNPNGTPKVTIVIYDAVGNVVFRSKPNDVTLTTDGNTFGFVWDGKNSSGRTVGPGTYLVRLTGTQSDGSPFSDQRKIGVTLDDGKMR